MPNAEIYSFSMPKPPRKKITIVREHPRHVPVSRKNPSGITIVDEHPRRIPGTYLDPDEIENIFKNYDREGWVYPTARKLLKYRDSDKFDEHIAVWTDYFSKKFNANPPLDPDVVKALIASESSFRANPPNSGAFGITQITPATLRIVQDPTGEAKDFIFNKIRQKDLKENPTIAIPMGVRWLFYKRQRAIKSLKREPTPEELILEYKGLLKSRTKYKHDALDNFTDAYAKLKSK